MPSRWNVWLKLGTQGGRPERYYYGAKEAVSRNKQRGEAMIIAIDPGPEKSAFAIIDYDYRILEAMILPNWQVMQVLEDWPDGKQNEAELAIEMVTSYGMPVGAEVFETVFWIGQFWQATKGFQARTRIRRLDVKTNLCHDSRAKDGNVIQALKDRFGDKGTKANPGWFYGFKADMWQAYAVGVTYLDRKIESEE